MKKLILSAIAGAAFVASGCGTDLNFAPPVAPAQAQAAATTQIEFLARPAIGEGLLFSNDLLNTYNAVGPRFVAAALANSTGPEGLAAAPIFTQAIAVLDILTGLNAGGPTTAQVVGGFLPDVNRIDTTLDRTPTNTGVEVSAYASALNVNNSPIAGRKITDDTIDITLGFITGGAVTTDGVPYYRPAGNTNENIGHSPLNGETTRFGASTFPYLAPPQ